MKRNIRGLKAALVFTAAGAALLVGVPASAAGTHLAPARVQNALQQRSFVWGELHAGDCQQDNGTIVLRSDGTGDWSATTLTYHTHSGDVWHASFDFYTAAGFRLFGAGQFDSPRMNDGNPPPRYTWGAHFTFNPADFNSVSRITQHYSC